MTMKTKPYVRQVVTGTAESHSLTLLKTRDLVDVSDEPVERGGTNEGMSPTEFFEAKELSMYCPISKMILAAGTKLETVWNITRPGDN